MDSDAMIRSLETLLRSRGMPLITQQFCTCLGYRDQPNDVAALLIKMLNCYIAIGYLMDRKNYNNLTAAFDTVAQEAREEWIRDYASSSINYIDELLQCYRNCIIMGLEAKSKGHPTAPRQNLNQELITLADKINNRLDTSYVPESPAERYARLLGHNDPTLNCDIDICDV